MIAFALALAAPVAAQEEDEEAPAEPAAPEPDDPQLKEAKAFLVKYLDLVKAKKWDAARKMTHPTTLGLLANLAKRTKAEEHGMAPWHWAKKDFYMKEYRVVSVRKGPGPTAVIGTKEDTFRIEEKGESLGDEAVYLVGKQKGKWWVVDKKSGSTDIGDDSVKYGYKDYFDAEAPAEKPKSDEP
jgi:hypothetical protein